MKKFSEFPQATSLTNYDLLLVSQFDGVSAYETKYITANLADSVQKRELIISLEQAGIVAPFIQNIFKDDFNDTYATVYNAVGHYSLTGFNNLLTGYEEVTVNVNNLQFLKSLRTVITGSNTIDIYTADNTGTAEDNVIVQNTYIRVTQYIP
jgi:hypothetical protein